MTKNNIKHGYINLKSDFGKLGKINDGCNKPDVFDVFSHNFWTCYGLVI